MERYDVLRKQIMERSTLLGALNDIPEQPTEHEIVTHDNGPWNLPMTRERQLAEDFVFISSKRDNSQEVTAVCIEEDTDGTKLIVRIASNVGNLTQTVKDMQDIANSMVKAMPRGEIFIINRQSTFLTAIQ
jgi:hypothetical protein